MMYVHVKWTRTGADDMVPERSARLLANKGDLTIVDPAPSPYRRFKPHVELGENIKPQRAPGPRKPRTAGPKPRKPTTSVEPVTEPAADPATAVATEPAPLGAAEPEEATK